MPAKTIPTIADWIEIEYGQKWYLDGKKAVFCPEICLERYVRVQLSSLSQYMPQAYTYTTAVVLLLNFSRFVENPFVIIDLQVSLPVKNPLTLRLTFRMLNASLKDDVAVEFIDQKSHLSAWCL